MDLPTPPQETPAETTARHNTVTSLNASAMTLLAQASYDAAFTKLKKALSLTTPSMYGKTVEECLLRAVTFNNMGILYKSVGQLRLALNYTNKALRLEINFQENGANPAGTHLNMCAILSQLGRHTSALLHAECALSCLYVEMQQLNTQTEHNVQELQAQLANRKALQAKIEQENEKDKQGEKEKDKEKQEEKEEKSGDTEELAATIPLNSSTSSKLLSSTAANTNNPNDPDRRSSLMAMIAIAYHNMAVEQEYLRQYRASTHSYRRAAEFAQKRLGDKHPMTSIIAESYQAAVNLHPFHVLNPTANIQAVAATSTIGAASQMATHDGKKKIPSWSMKRFVDPQMFRHVKVKNLPANQFTLVAGSTARAPRPSRRSRPTHSNLRYADSTSSTQLHTESSQQSQQQQPQQQHVYYQTSQYPNYPPPQHIMNPEEEGEDGEEMIMEGSEHKMQPSHSATYLSGRNPAVTIQAQPPHGYKPSPRTVNGYTAPFVPPMDHPTYPFPPSHAPSSLASLYASPYQSTFPSQLHPYPPSSAPMSMTQPAPYSHPYPYDLSSTSNPYAYDSSSSHRTPFYSYQQHA